MLVTSATISFREGVGGERRERGMVGRNGGKGEGAGEWGLGDIRGGRGDTKRGRRKARGRERC